MRRLFDAARQLRDGNADRKPDVNSLCKPQHMCHGRHTIANRKEKVAALSGDSDAASNVAYHTSPVRLNTAVHDAAKCHDDGCEEPGSGCRG